MSTVEDARGRWPGILVALGVDPKYLTGNHGPCPICGGGKDRFRFSDEMNGKWHCGQCVDGLGNDGFELLKRLHGWSFKQAAMEVDTILGSVPAFQPIPIRTDEDKMKACRHLLESSKKISIGDPVWRYLETRCASVPAYLTDIRFHPGLKHSTSGGIHPAMLAIMRDASGGGVSVHRTYLTPEGQKAPVDPPRKMMPGKALGGSCVRLFPIADTIGLAEGIETALSASGIFGMPVWAATCANLMATWEPPAGIKAVVIFGDNDQNFTGQQAAFTLAKKLQLAGIAVDMHIPDRIGQDFNDVDRSMRDA